MSWVEEEFTEADASKVQLNAVKRQVANRWFDTFPEDTEGSEGEVRYVYVNGMPAICVKMNDAWHFMPLQTIGTAGAYRTDDGSLTAEMLQDYMPLEPSYDSQWRQLVPLTADQLAGLPDGANMYWDEDTSQQTGLGSGVQWECIGPGPDETGNFIYIMRHGLGLSRPPKSIQVYVADSPPDTAHSVDTFGAPIANCLKQPYELESDAVADGVRLIYSAHNPLLIGQNAGINAGMEVGGVEGIYDGRMKSIAVGAMGFQTQGLLGNINTPAQFSLSINTVIISPNEMLFYPLWPIQQIIYGQYSSQAFDPAITYSGFQNFEWVKFMIWR